MLKKAYQWYLGLRPCYRMLWSLLIGNGGALVLIILAARANTIYHFIGTTVLFLALIWLFFWVYRLTVDMIADVKYHWRNVFSDDEKP